MLPVLLAAWSASSSAAAPTGHALLIGASQPHTGGELLEAARDVKRVQKLLKRTYGYRDVTVLEADEATLARVAQAIEAHTRSVTADDPVVVYIAGAGGLVGDANSDEPDPWDEAVALADGWLLDDRLHELLVPLEAKAGEVALVLDVGLVDGARFAGRHPDAQTSSAGGGDGAAGWARPGEVILLEGASRGAARVDAEVGGWFTTQLLEQAPKTGTWRALDQRLLATVMAGSPQLPHVGGATAEALGRPSFGVARDVPAPEPGTFRIDPRPVEVTLVTSELPDDWVDALRAAGKEAPYDDWMNLHAKKSDEAGSFSLSRYTFDNTAGGRDQGLALRGPAGATRARFDVPGTALDPSSIDEALQVVMSFARQAAFLDLHPTSEHLEVQIVPSEEQTGCSHADRWRQAEPNTEQIVPVCHRWQVEVALKADAPRALEVGGLILANDGFSLGFPQPGQPTVTLAPGEQHRFALAPPRDPEGVVSTPPLGISESVVVYGGPPDSNIRFHDVANLGGGTRSMSNRSSGWEQVVLPYRVEGAPADDPSEPRRTRELTLNHFDIRYLLPPNERSYLHQLLLNTQRLASIFEDDGVPYAQCVPDAEFAARSRLFYETAKWPNGKCWSKPWDFEADRAEFVDSPGIDCSTTVWWVYTRSCAGDRRLPLPEADGNTRSGATVLRTFHTEERGCLLVSDARERAGYQWTGGLRDPAIMEKHWESCDGKELRPGDLLVSQSPRTGSGHTYIVIDPDKFIVFGSHAGDYNLDFESGRLTDEDRVILEKYKTALEGDKDTGVEYQFLTGIGGGGEDRFAGFDSHDAKACWRHKRIARQWKDDPSSRPAPQGWTGDLAEYCTADRCERP